MAGGRPSKFTRQVRDSILQAISVGAPLGLAAQSAGVTYDSLRLWLKRGEKQKHGEFRDFYIALKAAEARLAVKLLAIIDKAAFDGSWSAPAWKMERRFPKHFSRRGREDTAPQQGQAPTEDMIKALKEARIRAGIYPESRKGTPSPEPPPPPPFGTTEKTG